MVWLAQNGVRHQRALLCTFDSGALRVGMRFWRESEFLRFENGTAMDCKGTEVWQPPVVTRDQVVAREIVTTRVHELIDAIDSLGSPGGLARLIPLIFTNATFVPTSDPLIRAAMNPIVEIARACRNGDMTRATEISRALIGLGQGLTPSGDDFLGGMLFAANNLKSAYPGTIDWKQKSIDDLLAWARAKTNAISYAILRDHAAGQSVDALHDLTNALLIGKQLDELGTLVRRLIGIGNTSGWDMLAGAMMGLLAGSRYSLTWTRHRDKIP